MKTMFRRFGAVVAALACLAALPQFASAQGIDVIARGLAAKIGTPAGITAAGGALLQDFTPNANYRSFVTGRRAPGYLGVGPDVSGAGGNIDIRTELTPANAWANAGYLSTNAGTGTALYIERDHMAFDLDTQGLLLSFTLNMATPGASAALMGNGSSVIQGLYLSVRTTGKLRVVPTTAAGAFSGLSDSVATVADGTDHHVVVAIDGPTKTIQVFIDGQLDTTYYQAYRGAAAVTSNWNFGFNGGDPFNQAVVASKIANFHALIFDKGLPGNVGYLAWRMYKEPAAPLRKVDHIARTKTVAMAIVGQSNEQGAGGYGNASGDYGMPMVDLAAGSRSMWPGVTAAAGRRGAWLNVYNGALGTTSLAHTWVGIVRAWSSGMLVTRGTYLLSGGNIYKCTGAVSTVFTATAQPTGTASTQTGADSIQWTYMGAARSQDVPGYVYPYTDAYFDPNGMLAADLAGVQPMLRAWISGMKTRRGQYVLSAGNVYRNDFVADQNILPSTVQPTGTTPATGADFIPWTYMGAARAQDVAGYIYPSTDAYAAMQRYDTRLALISIGQGDAALSTSRAEFGQAYINVADYFLANGVKVAMGFTVYSAGTGTEAYYQSALLPGWQDALGHFAGNSNVLVGANLRTALGVLPVTPAAGPGLKSDNVHMNNAAYSLAEEAEDAAFILAGVY